MRHRRTVESAGSHDRWLVSYADFITLLFAFFVIMFVSAQTDKSHALAVSEAVKKALSHDATPPPGQQRPNSMSSAAQQTTAHKPQASGPDFAESLEVLKQNLSTEIEQGSVQVRLERRGLVVSLAVGALFPSGDASISARAYPTVAKIALILNQLHNDILLEGHTDSLPINNAQFQSNWELSTCRGIAMLRLLSNRFHVESRRMAVVGYADHGAIDSNETAAGRLRNRRVDIVITKASGAENT